MASERFDKMLNEWIRSIAPSEKKALYNYGVGVFVGLKQMRIEESFMDACLEMWDPSLHVFRFPAGEICPLVEEFAAIGGWDAKPLPIVMRLELGYKRKFREFLGLTIGEIDHIFFGEKVSMVRFAEKFMNKNDMTISPAARRRALAYCLMQRYGFAEMMGESALGHPSILCVVEQMEVGGNPASLILGETIVGLDERRAGRSAFYTGCPRIMQVWLMERLGVLAPVENMQTYSVGGVVCRPLDWTIARDRPANYFHEFVRTRRLRWIVSWWKIREFTAPSALNPSAGIMICGLRWGVWIHPLRVMRQMGFTQRIPKDDTVVQMPVMLDNKAVEAWDWTWRSRAKWYMPSSVETAKVSDAYTRWTVSKDARENAGLRLEEKTVVSHKMVQSSRRHEVAFFRDSALGKRSCMDGPSKGAPSNGRVNDRLGEASTSKAVVPYVEPKVFDRLGPKEKVFDRLGPSLKPVVCGLPAKGRESWKKGPVKLQYVVKSKVVAPPLVNYSDDEDEDRNPKRKYKKE